LAELGQAGFKGGGAVEFSGESEAGGEIAGEDDGLGGRERDGAGLVLGGVVGGFLAAELGDEAGEGEACGREWQGEVEAGADAAFGLKLEGAAEELDLSLGDGESEAGTALVATAGALMEGLEDILLLGFRDAEAGIEDLEDPMLRGIGERPDVELYFADAGEFDGIADEVDEDLAEFHFIAMDAMGGERGEFESEGEAFLEAKGTEGGGDAGGELAEVEVRGEKLYAPRLDFGEIEHFVDEAEQMLAAGLDAKGGVALFRGEMGVAAHELGVAEDRVERGAELMAHAGEEVGLGLVGGGGGGLGALADYDLFLKRGIGAADFAGTATGVDEMGAGGKGEGQTNGKDETGGMAGAAGVGGEVEAEGGLIGGERFDVVDRRVLGAVLGGLELPVGQGFAEGEPLQAVGARGGFECGALRVGYGGIPGEGLEFGLTRERGLNEGAEVLSIEMPVGGVQGVHGMENLHRAQDRDPEPFDLLMGEIGGGFGGVPVSTASQVNEEEDR